MRRNLYLNIQNKETAKESFHSLFLNQTFHEKIPTEQSLGRKTANACYANYSSPSFNSCAMDGIAVQSEITQNASEKHPIELIRDVDYQEVDTGDRLPINCDAVIMAEDLIETEKGYKIISATHPFAHVRAVGEDIVAKEMVLPSHHVIRPIDVAVLLSAGILEVEVVKKPLVAIIPTGDEMIDCYQPLQKDKILETNSYMFENMIIEEGGECLRYPILADDPQIIEETILDAVNKADIVVINAGTSAGRDDYSAMILNKIGKIVTHGVAIKPGKPVLLGVVNQKPVIGLPGYPVSAFITFQEFVSPLINKEKSQKEIIHAQMTKTIISSLKYEEYIRVKCGMINGKFIATPLERGAGSLKSLVLADGFCIIPQNKEGIVAHEEVEVHCLKPKSEIMKTCVVIGSHDLILDIMNDLMINNQYETCLSSTHVGSFAGLLALKKKEAHLAPCHLLDETSGIYNVTQVHELFEEEKMVIIKGVKRKQGLIVKKGNPKNIQTLDDLKRVNFINRQKGSGTRVLFDYLLKQQGLSKTDIRGYDHEVMTHMSVAVAVSEDSDAGMGVYSASHALDLDFIEIATEDYDFVTYASFLQLPLIQHFIQVLKSEPFKKKLEELGGYDARESGKVIEL